jgi:hypothetical protein
MTNENLNYSNCILRLEHEQEADWVEFIPMKTIKCINQRRVKLTNKIEYTVHYHDDVRLSFGSKINLIFLNDLNHEGEK